MSFPFDKPNLHRLTSSVCSPQSPGGPIWTPVSSPSTSSPPPEIILLALWPHATDDQVEYYVSGYDYLYPSAKVILLRHAHRQSSKEINAVIAELTQLANNDKHSSFTSFEKPGTHQPPILLHFFGTKAGKHLARLLHAYQHSQPNTQTLLNAKTIIHDSEPSSIPSRKCLQRSPSKALLSIMKTVLCTVGTCGLSLIYMNYTSSDDSIQQLPQEANGLLPADAGRCFVNPAQDKMFYYRYSSRGGKEAASRCEKREFEVVRSAVGGKAGRQWTRNEGRYWNGIEEVWEGS